MMMQDFDDNEKKKKKKKNPNANIGNANKNKFKWKKGEISSVFKLQTNELRNSHYTIMKMSQLSQP